MSSSKTQPVQASNNRLSNFFNQFPAIPYLAKWILITALLGVLIGSASAFFLFSLQWATQLREQNLWLIALLPIGGLLIGLLYHYYGKDIEGGNNLLIDTIHQPAQKIPFKMTVFIYLGTIATHLFGGSAGREGTALQMAGGIADQLTKPLRLSDEDRRTLIIAAVAAGFGAVFGTPLAGAIFAMEFFFVGKLRYNSIFPAFSAAILANQVTHLWHAEHTVYHIPWVPPTTLLNLGYAVIAGIIFGICAAAFSKTLRFVGQFFKARIKYPPFRPLVGGIVLALIIYSMGTTQYIGLGIPTIVASFEQQMPVYAFAIKIALTVITLAAGFKGGEVTPLFFIGATLGSALAAILPLPIALLAGMGFVAVFAGATNTPLACTLMALELFGSQCAVYVAVACIVAYFLSGHTGIYGRQIIGEAKNPRWSKDQNKLINDL
ncbi:voltage-gated chloride channel family protein [Nubsella zeaxanthinifaciens]|uniref:voltage-gated chloride channel family protein n=1 Tax=Nubsella zeaxanthinifaciens TaxID=392412 RepID=UPI003D03CCC2